MPAGQSFYIKLSGKGRTVWEKELVTLGSGTRYVDYDFLVEDLTGKDIDADERSELKHNCLDIPLRATLVGLKNDRESKNNLKEVDLRVLTQKFKILMVESRPRWEERYVGNMFDRDSGWEVNQVISDGKKFERGEATGEFPADRDELFKYDIIWIGDISADMFLKEEMRWLSDFVEYRGGGLVLIDGQRKHLKSLVATPMHSLLPVEWNVEAGSNLIPTSLRLTDVGNKLSALQFSSETNAAVWAALKPPQWTAGVSALPGTEVLVESMGNRT